MAQTSQVEAIDLPEKTTVTSSDYIVVDDGTTTYKAKLSTVIDSVVSGTINASY